MRRMVRMQRMVFGCLDFVTDTTDYADVTDERPLKSIRRLGRLAKDNWPNPRQPKTRRRSDAATANRRLRSIAPTCFPFLFGAREATIFSKRGSPRSGSHHGISFNSPYVTPAGVRAEKASCSNARFFSPTHAAVIA